MARRLTIHTDGGARGNPGPAAIGVVIRQGHAVVGRYGEYIGKTTNNQAEYRAVLAALEKAKSLGADEVDLFLDSELVVKQLKGEYKIKDKDLGPLFLAVWNLRQGFSRVTFSHIPREENHEADALVNKALDGQERKHYG